MKENWATPTLKEAIFWREGMSPEEYDKEREFCYRNFGLVKKRKYKPLWKINEEEKKELGIMKSIDSMSCIEKLNSNGLSFILNGILECLDKGSVTEEEVKALISIEDDNREIAGKRIADYASIALSILNIKPYLGADEDVKDLIVKWKKRLDKYGFLFYETKKSNCGRESNCEGYEQNVGEDE